MIIATEEGVVSFEKNLDNAINIENFQSLDVLYKNDDTTVLGYSGMCLVFDAQGKFKSFVNISNLVNATEGDEIYTEYIGKGKVVVQVTKELTELEAQSGFTYVEQAKYFSLTTYVYDFAGNALTKVNFDRIISDVEISKDENYVLFSAKQIISKQITKNSNLIVTDTNLKIKVQLNDLVSNAIDFAVLDESNYIIRDMVMTYVYNTSGSLVKSFANTYSYSNDFIQVGNYFYDKKGNEMFKKTQDMTIKNNITSDGLIYYTKANSDKTIDFCIFNSKTGSTSSYDNKNISTLAGSNIFFTLKDADENIQIFSIYTGKAISNEKFVSASAKMCGDYYIISAADKKGQITYFSYIVDIIE